MANWSEHPFGDLYAVPSRNGVSVPKGDRTQGTKMINMGELFRFDRIANPPMARVPLPGSELERSRVEADDLLFARRSLKLSGAGRCVLVTPSTEDRTFESSIIRVRLDQEKAHPPFYFYLFRSRVGEALMSSIVEQVAVAGIRGSDLATLPVPVPSLPEQRAIADVLGALDEKIESNRRLSATCRELIRLELDARVGHRWVEVPISSLARFVNGGAYTNGASGTGRMVIRIAELNKGPGTSTVYNDIDVPEDRTARAGDLLMAWSGSLGIHVWLGPEAIVNQHIFKVLPNETPSWLVFDRLERVMPEFRRIAADKATTMGHIKRHHLDDALVRVPVEAELAELDDLIGPQWSRALAADLESRTLAELRDALLPELLSGRLRVPVAEDLVGAAT